MQLNLELYITKNKQSSYYLIIIYIVNRVYLASLLTKNTYYNPFWIIYILIYISIYLQRTKLLIHRTLYRPVFIGHFCLIILISHITIYLLIILQIPYKNIEVISLQSTTTYFYRPKNSSYFFSLKLYFSLLLKT